MNTIDKIIDSNMTVWTIEPEDTVFNAIKMMNDKSIGALPVVKDSKLVGIISERDYARKVILEDRRSKDTRVQEIMTANVLSVSPGHKIEECMAIMTKHHIRHLPVVKDNQLTGMISVSDVVKFIISDQKSTIEQLEKDISWGESY